MEDLRQFIVSLGLERPYLGGVSYGGMLLIEFLLKRQEMCRAALIVSATARGREKTSERSMYFPNRVEELSKINTPSLVVQATNDGRSRRSTARRWRHGCQTRSWWFWRAATPSTT